MLHSGVLGAQVQPFVRHGVPLLLAAVPPAAGSHQPDGQRLLHARPHHREVPRRVLPVPATQVRMRMGRQIRPSLPDAIGRMQMSPFLVKAMRRSWSCQMTSQLLATRSPQGWNGAETLNVESGIPSGAAV